jgi:hypothetical protein
LFTCFKHKFDSLNTYPAPFQYLIERLDHVNTPFISYLYLYLKSKSLEICFKLDLCTYLSLNTCQAFDEVIQYWEGVGQVLRLLNWCLKQVLRLLNWCLKQVLRLLNWHLKQVLRLLNWCLKQVRLEVSLKEKFDCVNAPLVTY